jgi:hypothetical protein
MNSNISFRFKSNEWGIATWLIVAIILIIAAIPTTIQYFAPKDQLAFIQNVTLLVLIIILSLFYKKLFLSEVTIYLDEHQNIIMQWHKIGGKKERMIAPDSLKTYGTDQTKGTKGLFISPNKNWVFLEGMGRKYYFYEEISNVQSQKLISYLKKNCPRAVFHNKIFG